MDGERIRGSRCLILEKEGLDDKGGEGTRGEQERKRRGDAEAVGNVLGQKPPALHKVVRVRWATATHDLGHHQAMDVSCSLPSVSLIPGWMGMGQREESDGGTHCG
jgi:hypothetical protein